MDSIKKWFAEIVSDVLEWVVDFFLWIPRKLYADFLDQIVQFFSGITPPSFIGYAEDYLAQIGPTAGYFFELGQFNWGFQLVLTAMTLKFAWSKIPFIGK